MTSASPVAILIVSAVLATAAAAQSSILVNGDFETVISPGCHSNVNNAALGSYLPSITGFGAGNEIDVYTDPPCYGLPATSGTTKLAIVSNGGSSADAFSFGLSMPILAGTTYSLSFSAHAVQYSGPSIGGIDVGVSDDPLAFGTQVGTFQLQAPLVWTPFSATFIAPIDAQYLTIQAGAIPGWTHTDGFSLVPVGSDTFCDGDGSATACPCANESPLGAHEGCTSSLGIGARLRAVGFASLAADTLTLNGDQMPNASALYFQGTLQVAGGAGVQLGDGLRCVAGSIARLGIKSNLNGASHYPLAGDASVHVRGNVTAPGVRLYQIWYRNAASFCTPSAFNWSNGIEITWGP